MLRGTVVLLIALAVLPSVLAATPSGAASPYSIQTDVLDAGGQLATNAMYSQIGSFGNIEGFAATTPVSIGHGYIAQIQSAEMLPSPALTVPDKVLAYDPGSQSLALSATLAPSTGTVNEGTVTFQLLSGGVNVGASITAAVSNNAAGGTYTVPAGQEPGSYTIAATYSGGPTYFGSMGAGTLTLSKATVQVFLSNLVFTFDGTPKTPTVSTAIPALNSKVVLTYDGNLQPPTGSATQATTYTVVATIQNDPNYTGTATAQMTINASGIVSTTTSASPASVIRSPSAQNVSLTATVTPVGGNGAVNEGTVTFQITDNNNAMIGSAVTSSAVVGGNVSVSYPLPAALPLSVDPVKYTITATYNGTANFKVSSDNTHQLSVIRGGQNIPSDPIITLDRNPARTNTPVTITALSASNVQPLSYIFSKVINGLVQVPPLAVVTPVSGQPAVFTTMFTVEGDVVIAVQPDDGYDPIPTTLVTITVRPLAPNDGTVEQNVFNDGAHPNLVANPNNGDLGIAVSSSEGGALNLDSMPGSLPLRTAETYTFKLLPPSGQLSNPATILDPNALKAPNSGVKFLQRGIGVIQLDAVAGSTTRKARIMIPISVPEIGIGSALSGARSTVPPTFSSVKGSLKLNKASSVAMSATIPVDAGLTLAQLSDIEFGLSNMHTKITVDTKGHLASGPDDIMHFSSKKIKVKLPKVDRTSQVTLPGQSITISFSLLAMGQELKDAGLDTEGVEPVIPAVKKGTPVPKELQFAAVVSGKSYQSKVQILFTPGGDFGTLAGRKN